MAHITNDDQLIYESLSTDDKRKVDIMVSSGRKRIKVGKDGYRRVVNPLPSLQPILYSIGLSLILYGILAS